MGSKDVQIRAVRSDGQVFEYHGEDWGLISVEGLDSPDIEIFRSNRGYGNGSIITGKRKKERPIDIVAREENKLHNDVDRAIGFHNSNYTFDLYCTYMGVTRIAKDCQLESMKLPNDNVWKRLKLSVSYLHPGIGSPGRRKRVNDIYRRRSDVACDACICTGRRQAIFWSDQPFLVQGGKLPWIRRYIHQNNAGGNRSGGGHQYRSGKY